MTFNDLNFTLKNPPAGSDSRPIRSAYYNCGNGFGVHVYTFLPTATQKASEGWNVRVDDYAEQENLTHYNMSIEEIDALLKDLKCIK